MADSAIASQLNSDFSTNNNQFAIEFNSKMDSHFAAHLYPISAGNRIEINREAKQKIALKNSPKNWKVVSYDQTKATQALIKFRQDGIAIRYPEFSNPWFIVLDFDSDSALPFGEIVQDGFLQEHALLVERSYSNDRIDNYKYHVFFVSNRHFSYEELDTKIKRWAKSKFLGIGEHNESFKFKQFWIAPKTFEDVFVFSESNRLDIDCLELDCLDAGQPGIESSTTKIILPSTQLKGLTQTEAFLEHVHTALKNRSEDGKLDVPSILERLGIEITKAKEIDGVQEFHCWNPWSETNNSGTSLLVVYDGDRMLHGIDRTVTHKNRNNRNHYTFLDLFHQSRLVVSDWYRERYQDSRDSSGKFKSEFFTAICDELTQFFGIEPFKFKDHFNNQLDLIVSAVFESYKKQAIIVQNSWRRSACDMFVFNNRLKCWEHKDSQSFVEIDLPARAYDIFPDLENSISETDLRKTFKSFVKNIRLTKYFEESSKFIDDIDLIAFDDYLLNVQTKEIIPNIGQAKNLIQPYRGLTHLLKAGLEKLDNDPDIQKFKKYFHKWSKCDVKGEILLLWFIVNVLRQGYRTRRFLCLTAPSKSGKTTYFEALIRTINQGKVDDFHSRDFASSVSASSLFSNYEHQSEKIEGLKFIFVDEVDIHYKDFGQGLRKYVQGHGVSEIANPKGRKPYRVLYRFGIGVVFEEKMTTLTTSGLDGRAIYVDLRSVDKSDFEFSDRLLNDRGLQDKILAWCLLQDTNQVLSRIKELALHPVFIESIRDKKADNDLLYQFVLDKIEITGDVKDRLTREQLFSAFQCWSQCQATEYVVKTANRFMKEFLPLVRDDNNDIRYFDLLLPPDWLPKHTDKGNFYCGLKLKTDSSGVDDF